MIEISIPELVEMMNGFLWPLFRISSFFMAVPLIGTQLVPVRVRLSLALAVTLVVVPLLPPMPVIEGLSPQMLVIIVQQMVIGFVLGFMVQVLFQLFIVVGQVISNQMGLGFASISDPVNGVSVVALSQLYLMIVMMLFLAFNGHQVLIEVIVTSFHIMPVGATLSSDVFWEVASSGSWMFAGALLMALPAVIALLIVNFAFGIMTKAAPQLNVFAIGFPFTMLFGLFIVWVSLAGFLGQYQRIASQALGEISRMLSGA
ncbi:flagellar biosynthetic protein FliR [Motiliproteus sp.]|uniref:flagellar biosynthetic protein FliR n=1 Tax=Motiliproteus sp. TaxID=1898955 RepID=UPI003BAA41FE